MPGKSLVTTAVLAFLVIWGCWVLTGLALAGIWALVQRLM